MYKRLYVIIFIVLAVSMSCRQKSAVSSAGGAGKVVEISDSVITASVPDTIRLGKMREGEIVEKEFLLRNTDNRPFVITNLVTTCGCTTFEFNREPVAPGQEKKITLRFDSAGLLGEVVKKAILHTSFSQKPYNIYIEATVE